MVKIIKKLKYQIEILFNDEFYKIEREVAYKYNIKEGSNFTIEDFTKILLDNDYYYFDRFSKNKLRKMLTEYELKELLTKAGANPVLINRLIENYLDYKYIDDENYVKTYIELRGNKEGPKLIKTKLIKKGIDISLIEEYLDNFNEEDSINNLARRVINTSKNLNKQQIKQRVIRSLLTKGYNYNLVNKIVDDLLKDIEIDEEDLIEKELLKELRRYQSKHEGYELKQTIKQKLYNKGYNLTLIEKVLENL